MSTQREWFINLETLEKEIPVRIGDGKYISAIGKGDINVLAFDGHTWNEKHLSNVLYVPDLKYNLFSVGAALDKGLELRSDNTTCELQKDGKTILMGKQRGNLFHIKLRVISVRSDVDAHATVCTFRDWHERMAHQNARYVKNFLKQTNVEIITEKDFFCESSWARCITPSFPGARRRRAKLESSYTQTCAVRCRMTRWAVRVIFSYSRTIIRT